MEYPVNMTTKVPDGTSEAAIQDIRAPRPRTHRLVAQEHLLRLWRPPLQPGEWRTLGLFAADDGIQLEQILAAMPLRIWRTDEVTRLSAHPNDPGRQGSAPHVALTEGQGGEFLVTFTLAIPPRTHPPTPSPPPQRPRRDAPRSWPNRVICCGSGRCPSKAAHSDCGRHTTAQKCRRSCGHYRCTPG